MLLLLLTFQFSPGGAVGLRNPQDTLAPDIRRSGEEQELPASVQPLGFLRIDPIIRAFSAYPGGLLLSGNPSSGVRDESVGGPNALTNRSAEDLFNRGNVVAVEALPAPAGGESGREPNAEGREQDVFGQTAGCSACKGAHRPHTEFCRDRRWSAKAKAKKKTRSSARGGGSGGGLGGGAATGSPPYVNPVTTGGGGSGGAARAGVAGGQGVGTTGEFDPQLVPGHTPQLWGLFVDICSASILGNVGVCGKAKNKTRSSAGGGASGGGLGGGADTPPDAVSLLEYDGEEGGKDKGERDGEEKGLGDICTKCQKSLIGMEFHTYNGKCISTCTWQVQDPACEHDA